MPCYACGSEFGILKKEIGCAICGFSFCGKCCKKHEILLETGELKKQITCNQCFMQKNKGSGSAANVSPPLAHKKRMAALKKQSCSVDSASHVFLQSQWSDDKDKEIAERLQKLKRDRIKADLPSESEIEERIAKLKGMDPSQYKAPPIEVFRPTDRRTSVEKAVDLFKQMTEEVELDSKVIKPEDEITERLAKLRASYPQSDKTTQECSDMEEPSKCDRKELSNISEQKTEEDEINFLLEQAKATTSLKKQIGDDVEMSEAEEAEKLVEKFMATKFDENMEELDSLNDQETEKSPQSDDQSDINEEFPWCVICSEDAKIRCFGCEGDLYCLRCFRECHDSLDIKDHKTCPFLPPQTPVL